MHIFMVENRCKLIRHPRHATDRDTDFAVIDATGPVWRVGHCREILFQVKQDRHLDIREVSQLGAQLSISIFEGLQNL